MSENTENTNKTKSETVKIDGISAQINLSPGSETHRRFAQLMREAGAATARSFIETLMDAYQNPHVDTDNSEVIANLEQQLEEANGKIATYEAKQQNDEAEIKELQAQLEAANRTANDNAIKGVGQQEQIESLQKQMEGAIILKPNPVSAYFLNEMAEKEKTTPAKILERLFIDDLQNPRANNLPYTVESSRIREVMKELKNNQNQ